jgi:hypothetical protein
MIITDEMVEAAARAIRDQFASRSHRARLWEDIPNTLRESYRIEARVALRAALDVAAFADA